MIYALCIKCFIVWVFRVKCGNETCYRNRRLPYEFNLIAMIPDLVLNATMYAPLTQLHHISNYRVVSAEDWIRIFFSTKNCAY